MCVIGLVYEYMFYIVKLEGVCLVGYCMLSIVGICDLIMIVDIDNILLEVCKSVGKNLSIELDLV